MIGVLGVFQEVGWSSADELFRLCILLSAFGFAVIPFTYMLAQCFTVPTAALTVLTIFYMLNGLVLSLIVNALNSYKFIDSGDILTFVFMILPHFALNRMMVNLQLALQNKQICEIQCNSVDACSAKNKCSLLSICCGKLDFMTIHPRSPNYYTFQKSTSTRCTNTAF